MLITKKVIARIVTLGVGLTFLSNAYAQEDFCEDLSADQIDCEYVGWLKWNVECTACSDTDHRYTWKHWFARGSAEQYERDTRQCNPSGRCGNITYPGLSTFNFTPEDGSWNIKWSGNAITFADVEYYAPSIELNQPAPVDFGFLVEIKGHRWAASDTELGEFTVQFSQGETTPTSISYPTVVSPGHEVPGAQHTNGKFWLGCTKAGRIKGNKLKDDNNDAEVYLTFKDVRMPGIKKSTRHRIQCKKSSSGGGTNPDSCPPPKKCCVRAPDGKCLECVPSGAQCQ